MQQKRLENTEKEYIERIEKIVNEMLHLSYQGLKELNKNKYLAICGVLRDSAFKIKQMLPPKEK